VRSSRPKLNNKNYSQNLSMKFVNEFKVTESSKKTNELISLD
jgi:hypothetical protein